MREPPAAGEEPIEVPASALLDVIERLVTRPRANAADIERALGIVLTRAAHLSNEHYDVHEAKPDDRPFARVEWREPASPRATGGRRLRLWSTREGCVTSSEVAESFGTDIADLRVPAPSPAGPTPPGSSKEMLVWYVYRRSWGTVSFGVRREPPECLEQVILELEPGSGLRATR